MSTFNSETEQRVNEIQSVTEEVRSELFIVFFSTSVTLLELVIEQMRQALMVY